MHSGFRTQVLVVCWVVLALGQRLEAQVDRQSPEFKRFITAGEPGKRTELDDLIERVGQFDFEAASQSLHARGEDYNRTVQALMEENVWECGPVYLWSVIADRRVARIYGFLNEMPRAEAAHRVSTEFDRKLEIHVKGWVDGFAVRARGEEKFFPIEQNTHALRSLLFLTACFGGAELTLNKIDAWRAAMAPIGFQTLVHPRLIPLRSYFFKEGVPDHLFEANILMVALQRSGQWSKDVEAATLKLGLPQIRQVPFVAWNAHTGPFDFTSTHRGVPVDSERVLLTVVTTRYWDVFRQDSLFDQEQVVRSLRDRVRALKLNESEPTPVPN